MPKDVSAPPQLELVQSFVNSVDLDHPKELDAFSDPHAARVWLADAGFGSVVPRASELDGLRRLRDEIRMELLAHNGEGDRDAAWARLATELDGTGATFLFEAGRVGRLGNRGGGAISELRDALAGAIYDALRDGTWERLKACRKHTCLFAFYDRSKNGSGAWCSMETCGNQVKAQRRRARERSTGQGASD